jgi:hypothetical protein
LFDELSDDVLEPILFFGYKKDKFGDITEPKLVYINNNNVIWTITADDISTTRKLSIGNFSEESKISPAVPKIKTEKRKVANDL